MVLSIDASGKVLQLKGQVSASGTIKAVDVTTGTVTIATKDSADLVLRLSPDSKLIVNGSASTVADLKSKIGARVRTQYDVNTKNIAIADVTAKGEGSAFLAASGVLKAVNVSVQTVTIATDNKGDITLNLTSNTNIRVGSSIATLGTLATKIGSQVTVEYDANTKAATTVSVQAQGNAVASGTLKAVNILANSITITTDSGTDIVLSVASNTRLNVGGLVSTLLSLTTRIGSRVTAEYDASTNTAIRVDVQGY